MTKKELLDTLKNSTLKLVDDKKDLYYKYYPVIEALLSVFPKNAFLDGLPILENENTFNSDKFESFIKDRTYEEIDKKLASLQDQLKVWISDHSSELIDLNYIDRNKRIGTFVFIAVIVVFCVASLICAYLSYAGVWAYWDQFSLALDVAGLISGLAFFAYEQITDNKKEKTHKNATAERQNFDGNGTKHREKYIDKSTKNAEATAGDGGTATAAMHYTVINNIQSVDSQAKDKE